MENNELIELAILKVRKKNFTNDKGDNFSYYDCFVTLGDKNFSLYPLKDKKELFKYLLDKEVEKIEEGI